MTDTDLELAVAPSRSLIDRVLAIVGYLCFAAMLGAAIAWWPVVLRTDAVGARAWVWQMFAAGLAGLWVAGFVRVVAHALRRKKLGHWLIERRRMLLNLDQPADRDYIAARRFVMGNSPFAWVTKHLLISSLLSIVFIVFVHSSMGNGPSRAIIVVGIVSLLTVPISWLASVLDAKLARSDYTLTLDI